MKLARRSKAGIILFFAAFVWQLAHTHYFGWNLTAQSDVEWWCDRATVWAWIVSVVLAIDFRLYRTPPGGEG